MTDRLITARSKLTLSALLTTLEVRAESGAMPSFEEVVDLVAAKAAGHDLGKRRRHELRTAASGVSTYLHLFAHPDPRELAITDGALLWSADGLRRADLLSFVRPDAALITTSVRATARRLLKGDVGVVRFVKLAAPSRSLYVADLASAPELLYGSPYWSGPDAMTPDEMRTVLGGEL